MSSSTGSSMFKQPKAVYAVAFACVVSFMGIGLVDPILPALAHAAARHAQPGQPAVHQLPGRHRRRDAVHRLGVQPDRRQAHADHRPGRSSWSSPRSPGSRGSIGGIVGFRAGWGLGNALFIATSLAVIVASATGGFAGAIVLYEAALGLGIAAGPLVGGLLGNISWRGPFFGVAVLMAIALLATLVLLDKTPKPAAPHLARRPAQGAAAPQPADHEHHRAALQLGLLHHARATRRTRWSSTRSSSASSSSAGACSSPSSRSSARPRLQARFGTAPSLYGALGFFAVLLLLIGLFTDVRRA